MSLPNFPREPKNAKYEFNDHDNAIIAMAVRHKVHGYFVTQERYEEIQGQAGAFVPKKQPKLPGQNATALDYTAYNARKVTYDQEQTNLEIVTSKAIGTFDAAHIKMVGHPVTGIINKPILEILTTLRTKYTTMLPNEMKDLKDSVKNGEHTFNPEEDIDIYLNHIASIHQLAANNHNAFSESDKVEQISMEMRKLGDPHLNTWLLQQEVTNYTIASKQYDTFVAALRVVYATTRKTTSKAAGYAAQAVQQQQAMDASVTMAQLQLQLQRAQEQIAVLTAQHTANEMRERQPKAQRDNNKQRTSNHKRDNPQQTTQNRGKKNKTAKVKFYCDTCGDNTTHWSNECFSPKLDHNANKMAP